MEKSLSGKCLLSSPFLEDGNFFRTMVYVLQHSEHQAFGLVLNRPTDHMLSNVVSMVCELKCVHDEPLYYGGPVDGPLIAIHNHPGVGGHPCSHQLYVTSDQDDLKKLFITKDAKLKLFDGFSGWGAGQLESELESGSWLVTNIEADEILSSEDIWDSMVKRIGNNILQSGMSGSIQSSDPSWN